jgi:hypothetical protein
VDLVAICSRSMIDEDNGRGLVIIFIILLKKDLWSFSMVWITTLGFVGLNAAGVITCSSMFLYFLNS